MGLRRCLSNHVLRVIIVSIVSNQPGIAAKHFQMPVSEHHVHAHVTK